MADSATTVVRNEARSRYELVVDGEVLGFADYRPGADGRTVFPHTVIEVGRRGQGLGAALVRGALDDVEARGGTVQPLCWYVAQFIDDNPEYQPLLGAMRPSPWTEVAAPRLHGPMAVASPTATVLALDHIVLVVDDPERTLAWYGHHAGLAGVRVDEWRAGTAPFPSLRVDEATIIDLIPGLDDPGPRGHLDHICFVVTREGLDALAADPGLTVVDRGPRFGARGEGESIYVHDPDGLTVEFRTYEGVGPA